ncbi:siroheme synthase [Rhizobium sp. L1K21]|uniref:siroheme synthase family protein n=1 Tax=Rhizobium sp. L1K21 TaxID=2954933 RepID=UPI002092CFEC|nr:SAM-dependent methyltransferase [Rhizobium sp. L1K21]MCO6186940.1 SAM-dependent methyltransferase [Rhizobium sp. L1K21]
MNTAFQQPQNNRPARRVARMEPLAKLPVFWDLNGKPALIAGATDAVAWKAELLAACGAAVHVYLGDEKPTQELSSIDGNQGNIVLVQEDWHVADLSAFAMALADCADDLEARAFYEAARAAGVPVNVIDKPEFCQFQFGSIVNRSPVVIAISTDGAAPILAQAIRRRIETLLPPALKGWAELARKLRGEVTDRLGAGTPRRLFWERFVDMAFKGNNQPDEADERTLIESIDKISALGESLAGSVTYVGAGPGDAEMLTLKAVRALQSADVILYEGGVTADVLELARREAKRLFVSECGEGENAVSNATISLVRAGKRVVRLVSGDASPTREIEREMQALARLGVNASVVRGVSAASDNWQAEHALPQRGKASA